MVSVLGVAGILLLSTGLPERFMHPIHAARVEVRSAPTGTSVTVRVYREDFPPGSLLPAVETYLNRTLVLTDSRGARVSLRPVTVVAEGERLRIELTGTAATLSGGKVAVTLLQEKFTDQVNVVDARTANGRAQLVFLRGDRAQSLP